MVINLCPNSVFYFYFYLQKFDFLTNIYDLLMNNIPRSLSAPDFSKIEFPALNKCHDISKLQYSNFTRCYVVRVQLKNYAIQFYRNFI